MIGVYLGDEKLDCLLTKTLKDYKKKTPKEYKTNKKKFWKTL